jgi:IS1 family transposase
MKVEDNIRYLKKNIEASLPEGYRLYDVVYRDINCGVFGGKGYTAVIATNNLKCRHGFRVKTIPDKETLKELVQKSINILRERKKKRLL